MELESSNLIALLLSQISLSRRLLRAIPNGGEDEHCLLQRMFYIYIPGVLAKIKKISMNESPIDMYENIHVCMWEM